MDAASGSTLGIEKNKILTILSKDTLVRVLITMASLRRLLLISLLMTSAGAQPVPCTST